MGDHYEMRRYKRNDTLTEVGPSLGRKQVIYGKLDNDIGHTRRTEEEDKFSEIAAQTKDRVSDNFRKIRFLPKDQLL